MIVPIDVTTIRIETERLFLRPLLEQDLDFFRKMTALAEVAEFSGWSATTDEEEIRKRFDKHLNTKETLAICWRDTNAVIGTFSIQNRPWNIYPIDQSLGGREFGFDLLPEYWGRGIMPEAVRAVTDYCFHALHYDFVSAGYFHGNQRSRRVIEKCGFHYLFDHGFKPVPEKKVEIATYIRYNPYHER